MEELKNKIEMVSDFFYRNQIAEGCQAMPELVRQLMEAVSKKKSPSENLLQSMSMMMEAMEDKNYLLLADIMIYEVLPNLMVEE